MLKTENITSLLVSSLFKGKLKVPTIGVPLNVVSFPPSYFYDIMYSNPFKSRFSVQSEALVKRFPVALHELLVIFQVYPVETHQKQESGVVAAVWVLYNAARRKVEIINIRSE